MKSTGCVFLLIIYLGENNKFYMHVKLYFYPYWYTCILTFSLNSVIFIIY